MLAGMRKRRRKPAHWLGYMPDNVSQFLEEGFTYVIVHCVGTQPGKGRCWHQGRLYLRDLPDESWEELCPWFRCTECGSVGYVNLALNWSEVIDFSTTTGERRKP
jgi:hypothetical protein